MSKSTDNQKLTILERQVKALRNQVNDLRLVLEDQGVVVSQEVEVPIQVDDNCTLPTYANITDAGADIYAKEDITLAPHQRKVVKTGIRVAIPEGYEIQIRPRSGLSLKTSLQVANSPGTIDAGYRDEVGVILYNEAVHNNSIQGVVDIKNNPVEEAPKGLPKGTYVIHKGDRIAQMVLAKVSRAKFIKVDDVSEIGTNRGGGFGHTGVR